MTRHIATRLLATIPLLVVISILAFSLVLLFGDPAAQLAGASEASGDQSALQDEVERQREILGFNDAPTTRYLDWAGKALRGDFGRSLFTDQPVMDAIVDRAPITFSLALVAALVALAISLPAGLAAGLRAGSPFDRIVTIVASLGVAVPSFWLGLILVTVFAVRNQWLPAIEYVPLTEDPVEWFRHLILPGISLGLAPAATLTRQLRSSVISVVTQDYVRTARAKGLRRRAVIGKHVLKNASVPAITALGIQIPLLLSGAVIIEGLFGLNGIGQFAVSAAVQRDIPVVQGVVMLSALSVVLSNLLVDISYGYLNPKTRRR